MNIKEKANEYAKDKGLQILNDAISAAYTAGYQQACMDGKAAVPNVCDLDEGEYIDLGLPSGTLWAKDYVKNGEEYVYSTYLDAEEKGIPTKEQFIELQNWCKIYSFEEAETKKRTYKLLGPSGKTIYFENVGYYEDEVIQIDPFFIFWLLDGWNSSSRTVALYNSLGNLLTNSFFMGYRLPLRLVKTKK